MQSVARNAQKTLGQNSAMDCAAQSITIRQGKCPFLRFKSVLYVALRRTGAAREKGAVAASLSLNQSPGGGPKLLI